MSTARARGPRRRIRDGLAVRLMLAQLLVITAGAVTLLGTAFLVAPGLFSDHLARAGAPDEETLGHVRSAFTDALGIALPVGALMALAAAGLVSWVLVRRLVRPIEQLADSADAIATGRGEVPVPVAAFSSEMRQLSDSFEQMARRLADVDSGRARLLADLAHELRTPLATLEAYLQGMQDGVVPLTDESWDTAQQQVDRLRRLSSDVREVAAAQEHALDLRREPLDMVESAASAVALVEPRAAAAGITVALVPPQVPTAEVLADRDRIGQVLGNLLDNAVRHTPPGGRVDVGVTRGDDQVTVTVTDTGPGVPAEQLEAIFERFHRGDPSRTADGSGSGLGLTIARAVVVELGGQIEASSPQGTAGGARFTVRLPALGPPQAT
ncbi:cell wall metabolism sensor histidine kinase WalK [Isoptericola sp. b408]|uniref:sensor histidine kinase n=1 Tax=Isoptericola sp. b408 TaxID=3064653 RepID=UPI002713C659|nr:HAMP domain-containing sensor histidine kinase [Isoptericola sp. b408]MDO8150412.1 HAMP domain-containing sensor histidine kinase [Isoptericola sp. b408]